ncbi:MAG: hypothetical protein WC850_05235 [Candidatus Gracilibacteria bacterium]
MLNFLDNRVSQKQRLNDNKLIDIQILAILNDSIKKINQILDNKNGEQKKLKYSQTKELQSEITRLIKIGRDLFLKSETKEEKENIIEQVLLSLDYLFANIEAKKVFVRYPNINSEEFVKEKPENQLMRLMIPTEYDIRNLESVSGGNCYNFGIGFYYKLLKEIIGDDKDIKIIFHIDNNDYHGTFSINDKFIIDSHFKQFSIKTGKEQKNTNFYKTNIDENIGELLDKLEVFKSFNSVEDLLEFTKALPSINTSNFLIGGKKYLRVVVSRNNDKLLVLMLKKIGGKLIYCTIDKNNSKTLSINIEDIEKFIIKNISRSENDKELLKVIFSKLDKQIMKGIFDGIYDIKDMKFKTLPGFLVRILENENIRFFVKKIYNSIRK